MARLFYSALVLLFVCRAAAADPLTVTSGFMIFTNEPGDFVLSGPGVDLRGGFSPDTVAGTFWHDWCHDGCAAGSTVDFGSTTYRFWTEPNVIFRGSVDGVEYNRLVYDAVVTFSGPSLVAPVRLIENAPNVGSGPFEFAGRIAVFTDESLSGTPLFSADLRGSGTAYAYFGSVTDDPHGPFRVHDLEYMFEDPAPIPEPSTLLLMGTCVAAAARRAAQRRRPVRQPS